MQKIIIVPIDTLLNYNVNIPSNIKMGDSLILKFLIFEKGLPKDISNQTASIVLKKSDGTSIEQTATNISSNMVTITLDKQATACKGKVFGEIALSDETGVTITNDFVYTVKNTFSNDILIKSQDSIQTLEDMRAIIRDFEDEISVIGTSAEAISALNSIKDYIDSNLPELINQNLLAESNISELETENSRAETNIGNLKSENETAEDKLDKFRLYDTTNLIQQVQNNTSQLNDNMNEINNIKTDYATKEAVNNIDLNKAEKTTVQALDDKVRSLASGSPKAVSSVSEMTDTTKNYVLTTDGNWYYYNGSAWVSGGTYQGTEIEKSSISQDLISKNLSSLILEGDLSYGAVFENGFYDTTNGSLIDNSNWLRCRTYMSVKEKEIYFVEFNETISNTRCDIIFWDDKLNFISSKTGVESFIVPDGASFITLNCKYDDAISSANINRIKILTLDDIKNIFSINSIKEELTCTWRKGYVADSTNTYWDEGHIADGGASSTCEYTAIKLRKGDLLYCEIGTKDTVCGLSEFNKNGYVSSILNGLKQLNDFSYIANKDMYILICNDYSIVTNPKIIVYPSFLYNDKKYDNFEIQKYDGYVKSDNTVFIDTGTNYHISNNIILKKGQILYVYGNCSPNANIISKNDNETYVGVVTGVNGYRNYSYVCKNDYEVVRVTSKDDVSTSIEIKDSTKLTGKTFNMLGDSYVHGHSLYPNLVSYALIAVKNGMTYNEYGINGNGMVSSSGTGTPMVERYKDMEDDADYIGVVGGRNDYNQSLPIGSDDDTTEDTFKGGLNILYKGLMDKYIGKKVFAVTLWNFDDKGNEYAQAERDIAGKWGIPIIDSNKFSRIYMRSEAFRTKYCLSSTDVSHLNEEGHKLYADWLENQLLLL